MKGSDLRSRAQRSVHNSPFIGSKGSNSIAGPGWISFGGNSAFKTAVQKRDGSIKVRAKQNDIFDVLTLRDVINKNQAAKQAEQARREQLSGLRSFLDFQILQKDQ